MVFKISYHFLKGLVIVGVSALNLCLQNIGDAKYAVLTFLVSEGINTAYNSCSFWVFYYAL